jgi:hypothetical protein
MGWIPFDVCATLASTKRRGEDSWSPSLPPPLSSVSDLTKIYVPIKLCNDDSHQVLKIDDSIEIVLYDPLP